MSLALFQKELIKKNDLDSKKVNTYTKYNGNLDSIIANKIGVDRKQITFFKTEQDAERVRPCRKPNSQH